MRSNLAYFACGGMWYCKLVLGVSENLVCVDIGDYFL